jgi:hypothetical protein
VPTVQEAVWAPEPVSMFALPVIESRFLGFPASGIVALPTELSWLPACRVHAFNKREGIA